MIPLSDAIDRADRRPQRVADAAAIALLVVVVGSLYGARLGHLPIVGEESRWATGAQEMLATGDWIVPRQQGQVFPERPPMTMWAMAAVGFFRGEVDAIAVRLPSVLAIVLTSLLVFTYTRAFASRLAALVAALAYATMWQVLQIGRMGESEALFTLLVSSSLLIWHLGYVRRWSQLATWSIGFGCAALAALVKGPQAPVYFVAITAVYLAVRRDWRYLISWPYAAGATLFMAIIAAWQVPFYLAAGWQATAATWSGLAGDRFSLGGLLEHLASYPLETFACLLPWSPLLVALVKRDTRRLLADQAPLVQYLVVSLVVTYPTVWLAAGARGRYFMPLYPLVAVLVGLLVERCSVAELGCYPRRAWHQFLLLSATLIAACGLAFGGAGLLPTNWAEQLYQPRWFCVGFGVLAVAALAALRTCYRAPRKFSPAVAVLAIGTCVGVAYTGIMINVHTARWNDPTHIVRQLKEAIPGTAKLVSLTPIDHRFAYYYATPIAELDWPLAIDDVPPDVDYFCFTRRPGDTAERREAGRGRTWTATPGTLPFAWKEVMSICVERRLRDVPQRTVVLGRIVRPLEAVVSDATVPQRSTAQKRSATERK